MSMNGNFARSILCSLTTSVDFGWYSSIVGAWKKEGACWDCVLAARGENSATEPMTASEVTEIEMARQDFIAQPPDKPEQSLIARRRRKQQRSGLPQIKKLTLRRREH